MDGATDLGSDDLTADCLDHAYFLEEIRQLLRMQQSVESELRKKWLKSNQTYEIIELQK